MTRSTPFVHTKSAIVLAWLATFLGALICVAEMFVLLVTIVAGELKVLFWTPGAPIVAFVFTAAAFYLIQFGVSTILAVAKLRIEKGEKGSRSFD